ncbi:hypothetical protein DJ031_00170 [bacterium endosymbiont of Escarpia laminata]|nr:MAG: hypothetical protein DJ031_00170 [bacterium endosymbiont of Escarpia laminata]
MWNAPYQNVNNTDGRKELCEWSAMKHMAVKSLALQFRGAGSFLSNFYPCEIHIWGEVFTCTEAAYQFKKARHFHDENTARKIQTARTGIQAKYWSKSIRWIPDRVVSWLSQRRSVMHAILAVKFRVSKLRQRLLATGDARLIENVPSAEGFWGKSSNRNKPGENILGVILMQVRDFVRQRSIRLT